MPDEERARKPTANATAAFKDYFSQHAAAYSEARPGYPSELFAWLAEQAPRRERAWDCATGNGQAARALAGHFGHVLATDASAEQIAHAFPHPRVVYRVADAESPGLEDGSVDLVTAAQAVHWFDRPRFYNAVRAVLVPAGLIAVWSYDVFTLDPDFDRVVENFYNGMLRPWWPPERRLIDERYATLDFPFADVPTPEFCMRQSWTLAQVLAYLATWSAVQRYRHAQGRDPLAAIAPELEKLWGNARRREVRWPLYLRAGRIA